MSARLLVPSGLSLSSGYIGNHGFLLQFQTGALSFLFAGHTILSFPMYGGSLRIAPGTFPICDVLPLLHDLCCLYIGSDTDIFRIFPQSSYIHGIPLGSWFYTLILEIETAEKMISGNIKQSQGKPSQPASLSSTVKHVPDANLVVISVPGAYAAAIGFLSEAGGNLLSDLTTKKQSGQA